MNHLSKETSPYLLQHAGNPVHWFAWSDEAWQLARTENKLVLVSIGYSACHWCHVMEHEVFENEGAAKIMNDHFVSIKVDREERPDVDQVYMAAVQLMTQSGGWPLNCFCLPDGRPVFGGTYFPLNQWKKVLNSLIELQSEQPLKLEDYAEMLRKGIESADIISSYPGSQKADRSIADDLVKHWKNYWDTEKGGTKRAPKFPMPNNLQFLIHYSSLTGNREVAEFVHLTLRKMALGGIYDQVGGGFARYSVDDEWKVPHFEKMLYDNAQLVSLYCDAFRSSGDPLYRRVVEETLLFAEREMRSANRLFFSALDADSDGIEGKFYTWTAKEINQIAGKEEDWVRSYFSITEKGNWESGRNILHCSQTDEELMQQMKWERISFETHLEKIKIALLYAREKRTRPRLDDKAITSWNAMIIRAYVEAYKAFGRKYFLETAISTAGSLLKHFCRTDDTLWHTFTKDRAAIDGFLDDYAFSIDAFISLHEVTGEEGWIAQALKWAELVHERFFDPDSGLYWYTSENAHELFVRQKETADNVMPSSNSSLCRSFFLLSRILENPYWEERSREMLSYMISSMSYGASCSNWLMALLAHTYPFREIVVTGPGAITEAELLQKHFLPNTMIMASTTERSLPLFRDRFSDTTAIYVCSGKSCSLPVTSAAEVLQEFEKQNDIRHT